MHASANSDLPAHANGCISYRVHRFEFMSDKCKLVSVVLCLVSRKRYTNTRSHSLDSTTDTHSRQSGQCCARVFRLQVQWALVRWHNLCADGATESSRIGALVLLLNLFLMLAPATPVRWRHRCTPKISTGLGRCNANSMMVHACTFPGPQHGSNQQQAPLICTLRWAGLLCRSLFAHSSLLTSKVPINVAYAL